MAFTDDTRLFTVLTRHAVYVEAVKANQSAKFNDVQKQLEEEITKLFAGLQYTPLDALTKVQLNAFVLALKVTQRRIYSVYTQTILDDIAAFMRGDLFVQRGLVAALALPTGEQEPVGKALGEVEPDDVLEDDDKKNRLALAWFWKSIGGESGPLAASSFPLSFGGTFQGNSSLWSILQAGISPANGLTIPASLATFTGNATLDVVNIVKRAYVNGDSKQEVINQIVGTDAIRKVDGVLNKANRNATTLTHTIIQQITSTISESVQKAFYDYYQWVSVMDDRTSAICIHRNLKIYQYGKGPLPPAHYRCRSKVIPHYTDPEFTPPDLTDWFNDQKDASIYAAMKGGKVVIKKPLTTSDFVGKLAEMLEE